MLFQIFGPTYKKILRYILIWNQRRIKANRVKSQLLQKYNALLAKRKEKA